MIATYESLSNNVGTAALNSLRAAVSTYDGLTRNLHDYCAAKLQNAERVYNELSLAVEVQSYNLLSSAAAALQSNGGTIPTTTEAMAYPPLTSASLSAIPPCPNWRPAVLPFTSGDPFPIPSPGCSQENPIYGVNGDVCLCWNPENAKTFTWKDGTLVDPGLVDIAVRLGNSLYGAGNYKVCFKQEDRAVSAVANADLASWSEQCLQREYSRASGLPPLGLKCQVFCVEGQEHLWVQCLDPYYCNVFKHSLDSTGCKCAAPEECNDPPVVESKCDVPRGVVVETTTDPCAGVSESRDAGPCPIEIPPTCCPPAVINFNPTIEPSEVKVEIMPPKPECDPEEEECPEDEPAPEPIKPGTMRFGLDWDDPRSCAKLYDLLGSQGGLLKDFINGWIPPECLDPESDLAKVVEGAVENHAAVIRPLTRQFLMAVYKGLRWATTTDARNLGCGAKELVPMMVAKSLLGVAQRWIGVDTSDLQKWISYGLNAVCPTTLPSPLDAHRMYLTGRINGDEWDCLIRANNMLPKWQEKVLATMTVRPNVADLVSLWRRGRITADLADQRMKDSGVRDQLDREWFVELSKLIPPYSDLVRMMVRDSFDDAIAAKYQYDEEFDKKFVGKAKEWAKAQGVDDDVMAKLWRAHWQLPSAGQAYTMLHRLRPEKGDPNTTTTIDTVRELLGINDVPKYWRDRLIAISYAVPRLVDLRNMYLRDVIDHDGLISQLQDRGYSLEDSKRAGELWIANKREWQIARPECKAFIKGEMSSADVELALAWYGIVGDQVEELLDELRVRRSREFRRRCVGSVKKRFIVGELETDQAIGELLDYTYEGDEAADLVDVWACEMRTKTKQETASMLCEWFKNGLITGPDMRQRLEKLGYSRDAAIGISATCRVKVDKIKGDKARKAQKEANKKEKDAQSAEEKKNDKANADQQKKEKAYQQKLSHTATILSKVMKTARKLASLTGQDWDDTIDDVRDMMCELKFLKGTDETDALSLLEELIAGAELDEKPGIRADYRRLLEMLPPAAEPPAPCAVDPIYDPVEKGGTAQPAKP